MLSSLLILFSAPIIQNIPTYLIREYIFGHGFFIVQLIFSGCRQLPLRSPSTSECSEYAGILPLLQSSISVSSAPFLNDKARANFLIHALRIQNLIAYLKIVIFLVAGIFPASIKNRTLSLEICTYYSKSAFYYKNCHLKYFSW